MTGAAGKSWMKYELPFEVAASRTRIAHPAFVKIEVKEMPRDMRVIPYDGQWPIQFEVVKAALSAIFGDPAVDIQYVGFTSIVGMWAKPILDIIVLVTDITAVDGLVDRMEKAGYIFRGESAACPADGISSSWRTTASITRSTSTARESVCMRYAVIPGLCENGPERV